MAKHFVEFLYKDGYKVGYRHEEVKARNLICIEIKDDVVGYRFFDQVEGEDGILGERENVSPITYLGRRYTLEEMRFLFPEQTLIMAKLERDGLVAAVKTKLGFWFTLQPRDAVVDF